VVSSLGSIKYNMIKLSFILLVSILLVNCQPEESEDLKHITEKFYKKMNTINKLQYKGQNIITFGDGTVWDNKGSVILEKNQLDSIFGFSFYGIRNDVNRPYIYKEGVGYDINKDEGNFLQERGGLHSTGRAGGQMVYKDFFTLENSYLNIKTSETDSTIIIHYEFEDDFKNKITEITKTLELSKRTFLPKKVTTSKQPNIGGKVIFSYLFSDYILNDKVEGNIDQYIRDLSKLNLIRKEKQKPSLRLNKPVPDIALNSFNRENDIILNKIDRVTLIDFWEVFCGPCIKSLPRVEKLQNKYKDKLLVIGIVMRDVENARKLVEEENLSFLNLIGNYEIEEAFDINSWPRYFLVDSYGVVKKEYFGFSDDIEKDIQELI